MDGALALQQRCVSSMNVRPVYAEPHGGTCLAHAAHSPARLHPTELSPANELYIL